MRVQKLGELLQQRRLTFRRSSWRIISNYTTLATALTLQLQDRLMRQTSLPTAL